MSIDLSGILHGCHLLRAWGATILRGDYNGAMEIVGTRDGVDKLQGDALHADKTQVGHRVACLEELIRGRKLLLGNQVLRSLALASDDLLALLKGQARDAYLLSYPRRGIAVLSKRSQPLYTAALAATHAQLEAGALAFTVVAPDRPSPLRCAAARPAAAWRRPKIRRRASGSGIGRFRHV